MNLYVIVVIAFLGGVSFIAYLVSYIREDAVNDVIINQSQIVLKEQQEDAKIYSRANDKPDDLLERMRSEND